MTKKRNIKVYVTENEYERIAEIAEDNDVSMSKLLSNCVLESDQNEQEYEEGKETREGKRFDAFTNQWVNDYETQARNRKSGKRGPAIVPSSATA
jgi:hypothetical protein